MNRRSFLKAILIASTAPAVVKADSLMNIYVPKKDIILEPLSMLEGWGSLVGVYRKQSEVDSELQRRIIDSFRGVGRVPYTEESMEFVSNTLSEVVQEYEASLSKSTTPKLYTPHGVKVTWGWSRA